MICLILYNIYYIYFENIFIRFINLENIIKLGKLNKLLLFAILVSPNICKFQIVFVAHKNNYGKKISAN